MKDAEVHPVELAIHRRILHNIRKGKTSTASMLAEELEAIIQAVDDIEEMGR